MADLPNVDLLTEIDDLSMYVDGKSGSKFEFFDINESVALNSGIPSHGLMDDAMLAVDSSNALLGDPLLNLFHQNELFELQSAAPSHNTETLMPVSLPAGSPTHPSASDSDCPVYAITTASPSSNSSSVVGPDSSSSASPCHHSVEGGPVIVGSSGTTANTPVCIVVKTRTHSISKMVAPITIQKPSHNLVKIPKVESTLPSGVRMQTIRSGDKLGPSVIASKTAVFISPTSANQPLVRTQALSASSAPDAAISTEEMPFRSLRVKRLSGTSDSSEPSPCGSKRKAYELEPQEDPLMERCRLNAISAKRNRELKKARMADLQRKVEDVSRERDQLAGENESLREAKLKLEQQVKHLNNVLKNQSKLSSLIGKLGPSSVILGDISASGNEDEVMTSGMCLHVDGEEATIEYCSYCAKKAGKKIYFQ
nr:uncharacterized protein LOC123764971 isoform X1 [Procambarus clarkii]